ncbi:MAG: DUF378 domain-containing protein [bacterium]
MKSLHAVTFILLVIGGLNWLLIGINPSWDLVAMLLGAGSTLARIVYILVGLSAVVEIAGHKSSCKCCTVSAPTSN